MHVVVRAVPERAIGRAFRPGRAVVVRSGTRRLRGLDDRPDPAGARGRGDDADLAEHPGRKAGRPREVGPGIAAVARAEEAAPRTAALAASRGGGTSPRCSRTRSAGSSGRSTCRPRRHAARARGRATTRHRRRGCGRGRARDWVRARDRAPPRTPCRGRADRRGPCRCGGGREPEMDP